MGGTAIALHIGHRRSIDFDLFKSTSLNAKIILQRASEFSSKVVVTRNVQDQLNMMVTNVKVTFFEFPFPVKASVSFDKYINLPSLLTLAAMKAFALGRRSKWKDYVDLYFIIRDHYSIEEISIEAQSIFGELFSEKLFRAQLCYFEDIDYSEEVEFLSGFKTDTSVIKAFLEEISLKIDF